MSKAQKFLVVYSGVLTVVLSVVLLGGFAASPTKFGEITVQRINVVEPDGTLRMVISNHARLPGVIVKGKETRQEDRPQAGMLFFNDEGSENGGLIFGGHADASGKVVDSGGSLSFDRYGASQIVQLVGVDDSSDNMAGLAVNDSKPGSLHKRIWVGRGGDGVATVALADANGKKRLLLQVAADGDPSISFLGADGKPIRRISAGAQ